MNKFKEKLLELRRKLIVRMDCQDENEIMAEISKLEEEYLIIPKSKVVPNLYFENVYRIKGCVNRRATFRACLENAIRSEFANCKEIIETVDKNMKTIFCDSLERDNDDGFIRS